MAMLFRTENVPCPSYLKVTHGYLVARPQARKLPNCSQPLLCNFAEGCIPLEQKVRIGHPVRSSHPAAQLVELSKPKIMGVINDYCVDVRNINTRFYYNRANKNIKLLCHKL